MLTEWDTLSESECTVNQKCLFPRKKFAHCSRLLQATKPIVMFQCAKLNTCHKHKLAVVGAGSPSVTISSSKYVSRS